MISRTLIGGTLLIFFVTVLFTLPRFGMEIVYAVSDQQSQSFDCNGVNGIPNDECNALVALYNATDGANWHNQDGWLTDNTPCDWYGVSCDNNDSISQIVLEQNGLVGPIPSEVGNLSQLTWLQLNGNRLNGSIPATLGNLNQITWLRLEMNELSGSIPASLGNMTALESLYLSDNLLTGEIPSELGNLPNLKKLYLGYTQLSGPIPPSLGNLSTLEFLLINNTDLSGPLPNSLTNLQNLTFFHLLNTTLCEPTDPAFQAWLSILNDLFSPEISCTDDTPSTPRPTNTPSAPTYTPTAVNTPVNTPIATSTPTTPPPTDSTNLCQGLITDRNAYPMTSLSKPALGQTVIDPQFGTTIRRITDIEATVTGEQAVIKPMYNTVQAWNADESYLILYQRGDGHHLLNGITYDHIRPLDINPADLEEVFWHFTDPDILFYVEPYYVNQENPGQRLIRYHVSNDTKEVVRSFANTCNQNEGIKGGNDVQMMSWDSDLIGLRCTSEPSKFFGYRISTDTITPIITNGEGNRYDPWYAPQAAPSGNLFFLDTDVLDSNFNLVRTLNIDSPEHASLGKLANGNDGLFTVAFAEGPQGGCGAGALIAHDLTDGSCRTLVGEENGYPYPPSGIHMSALAHKNPGWVAVSIVGVANWGETQQSGQELLDNELLLVDSTIGGDVCRVGHHRSFGRGGPRGYWAEPHVVISPSGTRLLFGSDWEGGPSVDTYVVELPSYQDNPQVTPTPQPTSTPVQTPVPTNTPQPTMTPQPTSTTVPPTPTPTPTGTPTSGVITGQVFEDTNGNGNYDPGENALAGVTVILIDISTANQTTTISTQTDAQGIYRFINLANVDYRISFSFPPGYAPAERLTNQVTGSNINSVDAPYQNLQHIYLPLVRRS